MLDYRHETFLAVYRIGSYTKAAQELNLHPAGSEPAHQGFGSALWLPFVHLRQQNPDPDPRGTVALQVCLQNLLRQRSFGRAAQAGTVVTPPAAVWRHIEYRSVHHARGLRTPAVRLPHGLPFHAGGKHGAAPWTNWSREAFSSRSSRASLTSQPITQSCSPLEPFIGVCSPDSPLAQGSVELEELLATRLIVRERDQAPGRFWSICSTAGTCPSPVFPRSLKSATWRPSNSW